MSLLSSFLISSLLIPSNNVFKKDEFRMFKRIFGNIFEENLKTLLVFPTILQPFFKRFILACHCLSSIFLRYFLIFVSIFGKTLVYSENNSNSSSSSSSSPSLLLLLLLLFLFFFFFFFFLLPLMIEELPLSRFKLSKKRKC